VLRSELLPVEIYSSDGSPLPGRQATIAHHPDWDNPNRERYLLRLLDDGGDELQVLPYESLAIAVDQAQAILGVEPPEWGQIT
jgi:hypothetical protein